MSPRGSEKSPVTFSRAVSDAIDHLIGVSGIPVAQVIRDAGLSRTYYYKRIRYELSFTTNDISAIAEAIDIEPDVIINEALGRMSARESNVIVGGFGKTAQPETPELRRVAFTDDGDTGEDLPE